MVSESKLANLRCTIGGILYELKAKEGDSPVQPYSAKKE